MSEQMTTTQLSNIGELVKNALSTAGAYCGECSFEPGDRNKCADCERCLDWYVKAVLPLLDTSAERVPVLLAELGQKTAEVERLKVEHERESMTLIGERDNREWWADKLADAVGGIELIGEHSSHNNPWLKALELITPHAEVQQLRARIAKLEAERHTTNEALSDAAEALREKGQRIAELEKALVDSRGRTWRKAARLLEDTGRDDDAVNLLDCMADAHEPGGLAHEAVSR